MTIHISTDTNTKIILISAIFKLSDIEINRIRTHNLLTIASFFTENDITPTKILDTIRSLSVETKSALFKFCNGFPNIIDFILFLLDNFLGNFDVIFQYDSVKIIWVQMLNLCPMFLVGKICNPDSIRIVRPEFG